MKFRFQDVGVTIGLMVFLVGLLFPGATRADFPEKPIQVLVGWPAGSRNDMISRAVCKALQKRLKQPVIVQDVPGGGGALVLGRVKTVPPDGYTLFQTGSPQYFRIPHLRAVPYDPFKDFAFLAQHAWMQNFIEVRSDSPWKTFEDLLSYVKKNPKKIRYCTPGVGTSEHVVMEYLAMKENLQWIHVPFDGGAECISAMLGRHVEVYSASIGLELEQIRAGQFRVLLSTNSKRNPLFPDIPSLSEKGYDFAVVAGACWTVPAGTPKPIQKKLETTLLESFTEPAVIEVNNLYNMAIESIDSESLTDMIAKEYKRNGELLKKFGLGIYKK